MIRSDKIHEKVKHLPLKNEDTAEKRQEERLDKML